jgi:hypothetical protein
MQDPGCAIEEQGALLTLTNDHAGVPPSPLALVSTNTPFKAGDVWQNPPPYTINWFVVPSYTAVES